MKVLIVVVLYNGKKWIAPCFDSIRKSNLAADVFVIDNASTDGCLDIVKRDFPETIIAENSQNLGFGKANNLGLAYAIEHDYDYVYLLNQDAWIFPDTLEKLVEVNSKYPEYGVLSPMQLEANMLHFDFNFAKIVSGIKSFSQDLFFNVLQDVYSVPHVMAAHWLISKACLKDVGGFSPSFPHYGEDLNYIERMHLKKWKVGVVPSAKAVHDRENRTVDKKHKLYRNRIFNIHIMSGFKKPHRKAASIFLKMFNVIKTEKSLVPVWNLFRVIIAYPNIRRNRKVSLSPKAFL